MSSSEPPRRRPTSETQPTERLNQPEAQTRARGSEYSDPYGEAPRRPWWENPWPAIVTGVIALLIGGGIGYAIGNSEETTSHGEAVTHTVTNTTTVERPKVEVKTQTVTASTVTQAPANPANEERRVEAETKLRRVEKENQELKHMLEEAGKSP